MFIRVRIHRKRLHMEVAKGEAIEECDVGHIDLGMSFMVRSKILTHFKRGILCLLCKPFKPYHKSWNLWKV
jgi:hypothetical protein